LPRRLPLTLACGPYDIHRGLISGSAEPSGIDLTVLTLPSPARHWRMARHLEFDVCEFSMGTYLAMLDNSDCPLVAIPAFPHRRFRHRYVFVRAASGVHDPGQLAGRPVGVYTWQTTAGIWVRGILQDEHGLDLRSIQWFTEHEEDVPLHVGPAFSVSRVTPGRSLAGMLVEGELDAIMYPQPVRHEQVRPLFADARAMEMDYARRTGIFPIMHTVVVRRDVLAAHPWAARSLLDAFRGSTAAAFEEMRNPRAISLAWVGDLIAEQRRILGPEPWAHGVEVNRRPLETLLRYAHEQGVTSQRHEVEDLFFPSTLDEPPS